MGLFDGPIGTNHNQGGPPVDWGHQQWAKRQEQANRISNEMLRDQYEHSMRREAEVIDHAIMVLEILKRTGQIDSYTMNRPASRHDAACYFDVVAGTYSRKVRWTIREGQDNCAEFEHMLTKELEVMYDLRVRDKVLQGTARERDRLRGQKVRTVAAVNGSFE